MTLAALIHAIIRSLKQLAEKLSCLKQPPSQQAPHQVARTKAFKSRHLSSSAWSAASSAEKLFARISPGDLVLLAARPGHGKTLMGLKLIANAVHTNRSAWFFTLAWNENDVQRHLLAIDEPTTFVHENFKVDCTDTINAEHIMRSLNSAAPGSVIVVDYLQLLDQQRRAQNLATQISELKSFAHHRRLIIVLLSQIDRTFDASAQTLPDVSYPRLVNPVSLRLFSKTCFLHNGMLQIAETN